MRSKGILLLLPTGPSWLAGSQGQHAPCHGNARTTLPGVVLSPNATLTAQKEAAGWTYVQKNCPCSWCWMCRGLQMNSHPCGVRQAHKRPQEPSVARRGMRQEVHPSTTEWRTSAPFLSPFLHAMSYSHLGKAEGSQFPWERCSFLAAYRQH